MEAWLAALAATTALIIAVLRLRLYIALSYRRHGSDDTLGIRIWTLGKLINYRMDVPMLRIALRNRLPWLETGIKSRGAAETHSGAEQRFLRKTWHIYRRHPRRWQRLVRQYHEYTRIYKKIMTRILAAAVCEKLFWATRVGTDDAAVTGIAAGVLWLMKSHIHRLMKKRLARVARPCFRVTPLYGRTVLEMDIECIFSLRLGNVINAIWSGIQISGKGVKGQWANTRSRA